METAESKKLSQPFNDDNFHQKINQFYLLMKEMTLADMEASPEERRQIMADTLRFDHFCAQLTALFGKDNVNEKDLKVLFRKISNNPDASIDWCELFGYQGSGLTVDEDSLLPAKGDANVFAISYGIRAGNISMEKRRLDITRSMQYCKQLDTYVAASKKGVVTQWNMKLKNVYCIEMPGTSWLVDCVYLPNFKKLLCCTERGLVIWDPKSQVKTTEFYVVSSFENAFTCMATIPSTDPYCETLLLGDDRGYIYTVTLSLLDLLPKHAIAVSKSPDGNRTTVTLSQRKLIVPVKKRKAHTGWVLMLQWIEELHSFISCSPTDSLSLVVDELSNLHSSQTLRSAAVFRGVNAFVYSMQANILASGGADKIVRVWHPSILAKPTGRLMGHVFTVVSLQVNEKDQHLISLSTARVVRVWCINSMTCLQIFTDNDDRAGERRIQSMLYDQKHQRLLTGSGVIDAWSLSRAVMNSLVVPQTHERPIVQVLYNNALNQYISLCIEPIIRVWDGESCNIVYEMLSPHGSSSEVTCMSVSVSGYRLATGATDGSIKIWDLGGGQEVKHTEEKILYGAAESAPVLGVLSLQFITGQQDKQRLLIASGWDNELRLYSDADSDADLVLLKMFNDEYITFSSLSRTSTLVSSFTTHTKLPPIGVTFTTGHKGRSKKVLETEQVTCTGMIGDTDVCSETLVVGTLSGAIILWDTKSTNVKLVFRVADTSKSKHSDILNSCSNKSVHMIGAIRCHHKKSGDSTESSSGLLGSSHATEELSTQHSKGGDNSAGYPLLIISVHEDSGIRLWTTDGVLIEETVAMTRSTGVGVTCFATDSTDSVLVTGDVLGYMTVWEVSGLLDGSSDSLQQVVSWRAHNSRVTSVIVRPHRQNIIIYTASNDGSIRVWFDRTCRYLGYIGQSIAITLPSLSDSSPSPADSSPSLDVALPCDIKEKPIFAASRKPRRKRVRDNDIEVPLVSTRTRRSSASKKSGLSSSSPCSETKFFKSLSKPKQYNYHLEHVTSVRQLKQPLTSGFVFRSLPVYKVTTPGTISYPKSSLRNVESITHSHPKLPSITTKVVKK